MEPDWYLPNEMLINQGYLQLIQSTRSSFTGTLPLHGSQNRIWSLLIVNAQFTNDLLSVLGEPLSNQIPRNHRSKISKSLGWSGD